MVHVTLLLYAYLAGAKVALCKKNRGAYLCRGLKLIYFIQPDCDVKKICIFKK